MQWTTKGLKEYNGLHINVFTNFNNEELVPFRNTTGHLYPIRDSCSHDGDPEEGCIYTDALFYKTNLQFVNDSFHVTLSHHNSVIVNDTVSPVLVKRVSVRELDCDHNTYFFLLILHYREQCILACDKYHGVWHEKEEICEFWYYLTRLCYRVHFNDNNTLVLDDPT